MTRSRKGKGTTGLVEGDLVFHPKRPEITGTVLYTLTSSKAVFVGWADKNRPDSWCHADNLMKVQKKSPAKSTADPEITSYYEAITEGS